MPSLKLLDCTLLQKIPLDVFLDMAGLYLTIVDLKRISACNLLMWQTCDHVRLSVPSLCFQHLSAKLQSTYFFIAWKHINCIDMHDIVRRKSTLDAADISELRAVVDRGIESAKGDFSFYVQLVEPLLHLCSLQTEREFILFIVKAPTCTTYMKKHFNLNGDLVSSAFSDWST